LISLVTVGDNTLTLEDKSIEDLTKTLQSLYATGDYQAGLKFLDANKEKPSPALWHYNMGTLYGKVGNLPLARYHLLRAEGEGFSTPELFQNKELVEQKLEIAKLEKPLTKSDYLVKSALIGAEGVFTFILFLSVLAATVSVWRKASAKVTSTFVLLAISFGALNLWVNSWEKRVMLETVPLLDGPSVIFPSRGEIPAGVFLVTQQKGDWIKVIYPSRFEGWIKVYGFKEL
jgi:hypothetical protein